MIFFLDGYSFFFSLLFRLVTLILLLFRKSVDDIAMYFKNNFSWLWFVYRRCSLKANNSFPNRSSLSSSVVAISNVYKNNMCQLNVHNIHH